MPNDKDLEVLKWLLIRLRDSEEFCEPYFNRAKRHYKLYRFGSAVDNEDWPYVNRVRSRDILAFIEDSTAILIQTLFASMPFFSIIPRETRLLFMNYDNIDPMLIGDQISRCLDYQISHEDTEFFEEMVDFFKGGTMLGNSYLGVYPKFTSDGTYLRPLLKTTDYFDVLPIVGARRVTKARGVFVREFASFEELMKLQKQGIYRNVKELSNAGRGGPDPEVKWHEALLQEVGMSNYQISDTDIEVIHYFSGGHIITFANRAVILRNSNDPKNKTPESLIEQDLGNPEERIVQPFPYSMPIVQYKYMPVPLEFFAMGIPEVLEVLQEDKNLIRSARRDNIDLVIQKVLKARSGADINFDLIKYYAGAIWPLENLNDIEPMEMQDVTQSSYQEEAMREHDMENALSLFGYARGMTPAHCVDDQTEILTDEGWKFFKDLDKQESVMTINPKSRKMEWQHPSNYISQDYDGWMISGENKNINFCVSPNHRMLVQDWKGEWRGDIFAHVKPNDRIPRVFGWEGESFDPKIPYKGDYVYPDLEKWVAFIGIFIAEGHARFQKTSPTIEIAQFNHEKKDKIESLLKSLPFNYRKSRNGFYIGDKDLCNWLISNIGSKQQKHIPQDIKNLPSKYLKTLFKWLMLGDGTEGKTIMRGKSYSRQTYTTNVKRLADDVQEIVLKIGKNATIHNRPARKVFDKKQNKEYLCKPEYDITILNSKTTTAFNSGHFKFEHIPYKGKIFCVTVPNSTILLRRKGQSFPTLNSEQPTTIQKLQQASLNRLDLAVKLAEFTTLQNIASRIVLLTRRFMDQATYEAIIGDKDAGFYRLSEEDIRRFYHFKPVGSSITNIKEVRQAQIQTAIDLVMNLPPQMMQMNVQPFTVDYYELLKTAYDAIDVKNVDRILLKIPKQPPMPGVPLAANALQQQGQPQMPGQPPMQQEAQQLQSVPYGGM